MSIDRGSSLNYAVSQGEQGSTRRVVDSVLLGITDITVFKGVLAGQRPLTWHHSESLEKNSLAKIASAQEDLCCLANRSSLALVTDG